MDKKSREYQKILKKIRREREKEYLGLLLKKLKILKDLII